MSRIPGWILAVAVVTAGVLIILPAEHTLSVILSGVGVGLVASVIKARPGDRGR